MTRRRFVGLAGGLALGACVVSSVVLAGGLGVQDGAHLPALTQGTVARQVPTADVTAGVTAEPGARRTRPPIGLDIAAIDLATPLVRLGLEGDRTVEVPTDPDRAGWFELGPAPGALGSAVILGHVDSVDGPAVFARLGELQPGDDVRVSRADGSVAVFDVVRLRLYPNAAFPAQRVYAAPGARRLNLVTCGGDYDAAHGGYQSNLVVYTRLARHSGSGAVHR